MNFASVMGSRLCASAHLRSYIATGVFVMQYLSMLLFQMAPFLAPSYLYSACVVILSSNILLLSKPPRGPMTNGVIAHGLVGAVGAKGVAPGAASGLG